jgi:hypothetical protein
VTAERITELERQEACARRAADDDLARRIAAAECAQHGHVVPDDGPAADTVEITDWGSTISIRLGPYCTRCGTNLSKETT